MNTLADSATGIMTPQIVFQCIHCRLKIQVEIFYAGQAGPCPQCGRMIQTPMATGPHVDIIAAAVVESVETNKRWAEAKGKTTNVAETVEAPKRWADPTTGLDMEPRGLQRKSMNDAAPAPRGLNRGIIADNAINRRDKEEQEGKQVMRMLIWFFIVFLVLAAATYLMKSFVARG